MPPMHRKAPWWRTAVPVALLAVLAAGSTTAAVAQAASVPSTPAVVAASPAAVTVAPAPPVLELDLQALIRLRLCVAADLDVVDVYLSILARTDLVGPLEPLAGLAEVDGEGGLRLRATVGLGAVRAVLGCEAASTTPRTATPQTTTR